MMKLLGALSALALLASAGAATAQQQQGGEQMEAQGKVGTVDHTSLTLTTEDGTEYVLTEGALLQDPKPGTEVKVMYREYQGRKVVTGIEPVQQ